MRGRQRRRERECGGSAELLRKGRQLARRGHAPPRRRACLRRSGPSAYCAYRGRAGRECRSAGPHRTRAARTSAHQQRGPRGGHLARAARRQNGIPGAPPEASGLMRGVSAAERLASRWRDALLGPDSGLLAHSLARRAGLAFYPPRRKRTRLRASSAASPRPHKEQTDAHARTAAMNRSGLALARASGVRTTHTGWARERRRT